ncbi:MAG: calcium:proton antiporter [Chthoniobacterales bacterium]
MNSFRRLLRREWPLVLVWASAGIWFFFGKEWIDSMDGLPDAGGSLLWICGAILFAAFAVVRHADVLAERFGEPYGTMILTFSVISLEVLMIGSLMLQGDQPTLARDTMYSVIMIVLTALVGACLLLGGLKFSEQSFNIRGAGSYLSMIIPLAIIGMVLPDFTKSGAFGEFSTGHAIALVILSVAIYTVFLLVQTSRYRGFFTAPEEEALHVEEHSAYGNGLHAVLLLAYIVPVVILAKKLAGVLEFATTATGAPVAVGGLIVACLILAPEGLAAVQAALKNQLQRSVNILLGSVLATIGLTIPAALGIGLYTGQPVVLGLGEPEIIMLFIALAVSMLTFGQGRTNMLQGAVHIVIFGVYLFLIFD